MIYLDLDKDSYTGGYQISITNGSHGYRITGPKYCGSSKNLERHAITQRDADEIRAYLDREFPLKLEDESTEVLEALVELEIALNDSPIGTLTERESRALGRARDARRAVGRFIESEHLL